MHILSRLLACGLVAALLPLAAVAQPANYQGLWWNSPPGSESGWGIGFAHQGDVIFAAWFTYTTDGKPWWLVMTANQTPDGDYSGAIYETSGPPFDATPFDPEHVTRTAIGSGTLAFRDADNGVFTYTVRDVQQRKYITRHVSGPVPTCVSSTRAELSSATNYSDLWWVPGGAESGWGIHLSHQGDVIFATWFTYGSDGKPTWLAATAPLTSPGVYAGKLFRMTGPAFAAQPFDPSRVTRTEAGTITLTFRDGDSARFAYTVDGVSQAKTLARHPSSPVAATRCGEPMRTVATFSVVAAGDIANCSYISPTGETAASRTARLVNPGDALVLTLGDAAYESGSAYEYANCFQRSWGAFHERIRPVPGNHDYDTSGADGYFGYFGARAGADRRGYYSFDHGGWHFIMLNSMAPLHEGSPQNLWMRDDLARSRDSLCTIAVMHHPAFNSGANHGSVLEMRSPFHVLQSAGVDIVLAGHEHVYERFAPQRADGAADPARGARHFTVGTGGGLLMSFGPPLANSEFRYSSSWGILRLTLGSGQYSWQFLSVNDASPIDSGSGTCHP